MVQWAPITGLSDSCSPPLWLHLHWERQAADGWPVEDIVSSHRVISPDSPQETMVHCTQFKGLTVHGGILLYERGGCVFYLQLTIWERSWGNIESQDFSSPAGFKFCLFWDRTLSFPALSNILTERRRIERHVIISFITNVNMSAERWVWSHQLTAVIHHWILFSQSSNQNINCAAVLGFAASIHLRVH